MDYEKKAVVIGATSGIGRELALLLEKNGWQVGATGRRTPLLDDLCTASTHGGIIPLCFDATEASSLEQNLATLEKMLGGLDLFIISAGTGFLNPELDPDLELQTVATNVQAFTRLCDWAFSRFESKKKGHLAAITSVSGLIADANSPAYSASKAYQVLYLDGLRKRAKGKALPITITDIRPGSVDTDMMKGEGHFWISSAHEAALLAYEGIAKGKTLQYVSGRWSLVGISLRIASIFR